MRILRTVLVAGLALLADFSVAAELQVARDPVLQLECGSKKIILSDSFKHTSFTRCQLQTADRTGTEPETFNVFRAREDKSLELRKEVTASPDRVEVTVWNRMKAGAADALEYRIELPGSLRGSRYRAAVGRHRDTSVTDGILSSGVNIERLRFLWLDVGGGVWLDLDPQGVWAIEYSLSHSYWTLREENGRFLVCATRTSSNQGDVFEGKVVIGVGGWCFERIHPKQADLYSTPLACSRTCVFGAGPDGLDPILAAVRCGLEPYDKKKKWGWIDSDGLTLNDAGTRASFPGDGWVQRTEPGNAAFRIACTPGWYFLHCWWRGKPDESVTVQACGRPVDFGATHQQPNSEMRSSLIHVPDHLELSIAGGPWKLAAISLQPILYDTEDYVMNGAWWKVPPGSFPEAYPPLKVAGQTTATNPPADWSWDCALVNWATNNSGAREQFDTVDEASKRANELKALGFTAVILNGVHFRYNFPDHYQSIAAHARLAVEACHRAGLAVIEHHEYTIPHVDGYKRLAKDYRWLQRDTRYGIFRRWFCLANPEFLQSYVEYLKSFQRETNVDGYMLDELQFNQITACGCQNCRAGFRTAAGVDLPLKCDTNALTRREPPYDKWHAYRMKSIGNANAAIADALHTVRNDLAFWSYCTLFSNPASIKTGPCIQENYRGIEAGGMETMTRTVFVNWKALLTEMKIRSGLAESFGKPSWNLMYSLDDGNCYFSWAMARMCKQSLWMLQAPSDKVKGYISWPEQMHDRNAQAYADVALLCSVSSRNAPNSETRWYPDAFGWGETLLANNIQFQVLMDRDVELQKLQPFKAVLVPGDTCLSARQQEVLAAYARNGGQVVLSGHSGLLDEWGAPTSATSALYREAGWEPGPEIKSATTVSAEAESPLASTLSGGINWPGKPAVGVRTVKALASSVLALATGEDESTIPIVTVTNIGNGKLVHLGVGLGEPQFERPLVKGDVWSNDSTTATTAFACALIRNVLGCGQTVSVATETSGVQAIAYHETRNGKKELVIHLLNCSGAIHCNGDVVSDALPPNYPAIPGRIALTIRCPKPADAYAVSPDWPGRRRPEIRTDGDRTVVTLDGSDLKTYCMVRLAP